MSVKKILFLCTALIVLGASGSVYWFYYGNTFRADLFALNEVNDLGIEEIIAVSKEDNLVRIVGYNEYDGKLTYLETDNQLNVKSTKTVQKEEFKIEWNKVKNTTFIDRGTTKLVFYNPGAASFLMYDFQTEELKNTQIDEGLERQKDLITSGQNSNAAFLETNGKRYLLLLLNRNDIRRVDSPYGGSGLYAYEIGSDYTLENEKLLLKTDLGLSNYRILAECRPESNDYVDYMPCQEDRELGYGNVYMRSFNLLYENKTKEFLILPEFKSEQGFKLFSLPDPENWEDIEKLNDFDSWDKVTNGYFFDENLNYTRAIDNLDLKLETISSADYDHLTLYDKNFYYFDQTTFIDSAAINYVKQEAADRSISTPGKRTNLELLFRQAYNFPSDFQLSSIAAQSANCVYFYVDKDWGSTAWERYVAKYDFVKGEFVGLQKMQTEIVKTVPTSKVADADRLDYLDDDGWVLIHTQGNKFMSGQVK